MPKSKPKPKPKSKPKYEPLIVYMVVVDGKPTTFWHLANAELFAKEKGEENNALYYVIPLTPVRKVTKRR